MTRNKRDIIIVFCVTVLLLGVLAVLVGAQKGDLSFDVGGDRELDVEIPRAPAEEEGRNATKQGADVMNVLDMETQNVIVMTNKGDITFELFTGAMPITTQNFLTLAREDFYDETKFHRVIEGFMIQGGDPNSKGDDTATYGQGGPGYTIADEFVEGDLLTNTRGTIAMANTGQPNSGGSQFFINLADNTFLDFDKEPLTSKHPVFGRVVGGMEVVRAIADVDTMPGDIPIDPIVVEDVVVPEE